MESLRFLMVSTHYPPEHIGGDAVMARNLSNELARRGHDVHVFRNVKVYDLVRGRHIKSTSRGFGYSSNVTIHESMATNSAINIALSHTLGFDNQSISQLRDIVADIKPDVVHWHNTKAFIGTPLVFDSVVNLLTAHDYYAICPKSSLLKPGGVICPVPDLCQACQMTSGKIPQLWRIGKQRLLRIPKNLKIISPSNYLANRLREEGLQVAKVIPNFVDNPGPVKYDASSDIVVFVGILEPHKGPQILVDAFAATMKQHSLSLHIIGEGSLKSALRERVMRLGASDRIILAGRLPDYELRKRLSEAVALVVPSIWLENCPLVALEALSYGVPVLASAIGGLSEIVTNVSGSATFLPGNREDLERGLLGVCHDWRGDMKLRQSARDIYNDRYSPDKHINLYMDVVSNSVN